MSSGGFGVAADVALRPVTDAPVEFVRVATGGPWQVRKASPAVPDSRLGSIRAGSPGYRAELLEHVAGQHGAAQADQTRIRPAAPLD